MDFLKRKVQIVINFSSIILNLKKLLFASKLINFDIDFLGT